MSATTYGWLVLAFPLAGTLVISLGWRVLPGRVPGWIASAAILLSFIASIGALLDLQDHAHDDRQLVDSLWTYASTVDFRVDLSILVDPLSVFMCLVVSGVSFLIHVYSVAYMTSDRGYARYFAYLNFFVFSMLLLVLAANFVILIIGWAFVGAASYLLISYWYRRGTAVAAGIKAFVINVIGDVGLVIAAFLILDKTGSLDYLPVFDRAGRIVRDERRHHRGDRPPAAGGRLREVGSAPAPHLAPGRDGGPHARLRADPRRDDGHRGRLPDRAHASAVRAGPDRGGRRRDHRHRDAAVRGDGRDRPDRPQARDRLLHDLADRLHGARRVDRRLRRRPLPPDDARLLQGASLHGRRLGDRGDGGGPGHGPDGRLPARDAVHVRDVHHRRAGAGRRSAARRLLLEGRDPRVRAQPRRGVRGAGGARLHRRLPDRDLRIPHGVPGVLRRPGAGGGGARGRPRGARRADEPDDRRGRGHGRGLPGGRSTTWPSARGR